MRRVSKPNQIQAAPVVALAVTALFLAGGCGGKKKQAPAPAPATQQGRAEPRPQEPAPRDEPTIAFAPQEEIKPLAIPAHVEFPEERRPSDRPLAEAIVRAASAIAAGDADALSALLDDTAREAFDLMRSHGFAPVAFENIQRVRVCALHPASDEAEVALGVQRSDGATLVSLRAARRGDSWVFQGLTPLFTPFASAVEDFDGVQLAEAPLPEPLAPEEALPTDADATKQKPTRANTSTGIH